MSSGFDRSDCHPKQTRWSRRSFLGCLALTATASWAQAPGNDQKVRVGWLSLRDTIFKEPYSQAFVARLRELGYAEGQNLTLDRRDAGGSIERLSTEARELVASRPDVIFSGGGEAALVALKKASPAIPVVFVAVDFDPFQAGHFTSASRPGGVLTGVSANQSLLPGKRLELLRILLPRAERIAVFSNPDTTGQLAVAQQAADTLGLRLVIHEFKALPYDYELGIERVVRERADALSVFGSGLFVSARQRLPQLALAARLPTMFHQAQWVEAGGLMSYGYNFSSLWRMGAEMVSRLLNRVPVAELPIEFPTSFELAINSTTARILGIEIPYEMKLRADRLIG